MKCPKCGYLGFEAVDRCRNCGYEFALASATRFAEFPLREDAAHTLNEFSDLSMIDEPAAPQPDVAITDVTGNLETMFESTPAPPPRPSIPRELPLFGRAEPDDEPLIKTPSAPRAPLAVRRSTPEVPRVRAEQP